jgi:hypothetical protein
VVLARTNTTPLGFTSIAAAPVGTGACLVSRPGFSVVPELHSAPKNAEGRGAPFLGSDRQVVVGYTGTRLPIAVNGITNGRGRSHLRRRLRLRAFGHFQLHIDFYYNSFYFICIISFSGLHVLGLEGALHDHAPIRDLHGHRKFQSKTR